MTAGVWRTQISCTWLAARKHGVSKQLIQGCLLYDFKMGLSVAASSRWICQAFGDNVVSARNARHWFQKFKSGDPFVINPCYDTETNKVATLVYRAERTHQWRTREQRDRHCFPKTKKGEFYRETTTVIGHSGSTTELSRFYRLRTCILLPN